MKRLLVIFMAFIPLAIFCQSNDTTKMKKMSIGLMFSPDYCYRTLKPDASSISIADYRDSLEIPKFGFTTGACFAFQLNKRIAFETGLLYSDKGEQIKKNPLVQLTPGSPSNTSFIYHYFYIDIPIKANYYLLTQRTKVFITAGISPNIFISQKTKSILEYSDGQTKTYSSSADNGFTRINLTFTAGLGFSYELTSKLYLKVEPTYKRSITSIIDAPIKGYLYSVGLNTGIYFRL